MNDKRLSVMDIAREINVPKYTIRYWQSQFSEFFPKNRTPGNHRRFTDEDVALLLQIKKLLHEDKYSVKGAWHQLSKQSKAQAMAARSVDEIAQAMARRQGAK